MSSMYGPPYLGVLIFGESHYFLLNQSNVVSIARMDLAIV